MAESGQNRKMLFCVYEVNMQIYTLIIVYMDIETMFEYLDVNNILKCVQQIGQLECCLLT